MEFGVWILDFGFWILDFGFWILDLGFWILDFGFWSLDFGFWISLVFVLFVAAPNGAVWILEFGFWIIQLVGISLQSHISHRKARASLEATDWNFAQAVSHQSERLLQHAKARDDNLIELFYK